LKPFLGLTVDDQQVWLMPHSRSAVCEAFAARLKHVLRGKG